MTGPAAAGPLFSVIMASYNAGDYLVPAVESALGQLRDGDELVIQDACSTDGSIEILLDRHGSDPRLKVVREPDGGQSDGLQRALDRVANEYLGWLNADDLYFPGALDAVRAVARRDGVDIVYGSSVVFDNDDHVLRRTTPADFTVESFVRHGCHAFSGATFVRTELARSAGGFDTSLHYAMDYDLFFRLARQARTWVRLPDVLGGLRWHEASKTGSVIMPFFREAFRIRMSYARTLRERAWVAGQMTLRLSAIAVRRLVDRVIQRGRA